MGRGAGYGGAERPAGLLSSGTGPFSMAQGAGPRATGVNSLLDLNGAQNPYQNGGVTQNPESVTEEMISELKGYLESPGQDQDRGGDGGGYQSGGGFNTNAPEAPAWMGALSPMALAAYNAMMRNGFDPSAGFYGNPNVAFGSQAWSDSVNANAAARGSRQGDGGGYDVGGVDYGNDAMDYGG